MNYLRNCFYFTNVYLKDADNENALDKIHNPQLCNPAPPAMSITSIE